MKVKLKPVKNDSESKCNSINIDKIKSIINNQENIKNANITIPDKIKSFLSPSNNYDRLNRKLVGNNQNKQV